MESNYTLILCIFSILQFLSVNSLCPRVAKWKTTKFCKNDEQIGSNTHKWFSNTFTYGKTLNRYEDLNLRSEDTRVVRKEYRTLRTDERRRLHRCLLEMTSTLSMDEGSYYGQSEFSSFVTQHRFQYSPQAHGSPAFSPYHRVFLFFFESLLQTHKGCEDIGLPYWDSTLDSYLPNPADSAIFEDGYLGASKGVVTADYVNDTAHITTTYCRYYGEKLMREVCKDGNQLMTDDAINEFIKCSSNYSLCTMPTNPRFEEGHGLVHGCLGGHMNDLSCAPYDFLFYLHHSFVDLLFDKYLERAFPDEDPVNAYIKDSPTYYVRGDEPMRPFERSGYRVRDGMSRNFTRDFYRYARRPFTCRRDSHCMSALLWCDSAERRCKAKVRLGGDCSGLDEKKSCFSNGKCGRNGAAVCSPETSQCQCAIES